MVRSRARQESAKPCEVVPGDHECPCPSPGFGDPLHLCGVHWQEYKRLTANYKALSEKAENLYAKVLDTDWTDESLWTVDVVDDSLATASRCARAFDEEILSRQEHHRRFFPLRDEHHKGHEAWIEGLRVKLGTVQAIVKQLRVCRIKVENEKQRAGAKGVRVGTPRPSYIQRSAPTWTSFDEGIGRDDGTRCLPSSLRIGTAYCSPRLHRPGCVALDIHSSHCYLEPVAGQVRCQRHENAYEDAESICIKASSALYRAEGTLSTIRRRIPLHNYYGTQDHVVEDIKALISYQQLQHKLRDAQDQRDRLCGRTPQPTAAKESYADVQRLLQDLQSIKVRLQNAGTAAVPSSERSNRSSKDSEESGGWIMHALTAVALGVAAWFGSQRKIPMRMCPQFSHIA